MMTLKQVCEAWGDDALRERLQYRHPGLEWGPAHRVLPTVLYPNILDPALWRLEPEPVPVVEPVEAVHFATNYGSPALCGVINGRWSSQWEWGYQGVRKAVTCPACLAKKPPERVVVPPGDLTWQEAKEAHERGEKVEFMGKGGSWWTIDAWFEGATQQEIESAAYRRKPAPKMVPIGPDAGLLMKYFVLKPAGHSPYSLASREAMRAYSESIRQTNQTLAEELLNWIAREEQDAKKEAP